MCDTDRLKSDIRTLEAAVASYAQAKDQSVEQEVFRLAIVKGFELTQETAFKLLKRALLSFGHGGQKLEATPVKPLLRLAGIHELMSEEAIARWFEYRDNRNNTAHDYGLLFVQETLALMPTFILDANTLLERLTSHFAQTLEEE